MDNANKQDLLNALMSDSVVLDALLLRVEEMQHEKYLKQHKSSIWQGSNGKWLTYLPTKSGRKQISSASEKGLKKKICDYYKQLEQSPTVEDVFEFWLDEKLQTDIVNRTADKYRTDFLRFFDEDFRKLKISEIDENDLSFYIRSKIKDMELTQKAYGAMRILIIGIFKYARVHNFTDIGISAFFDGLDINKRAFKSAYKPDKSQIYTDDDLIKLIRLLEAVRGIDEPVALGILFVFRTGLRVGELSALKFNDIEGNILTVKRQHLTHKDIKNHTVVHRNVDYTKTVAGLREIVLTDKALEVIERASEISDSDFVFTKNGKQILDDTYNKLLRRLCRNGQIEYRSIHKIRKTFATMLLNSGVDEIYVKKIMGHESISTTKNYYYYCNKTKTDYERQIKSAITI